MSSSLLIAKVLGGTASLGSVGAAVSMGVVWSQPALDPKSDTSGQQFTPPAKVVVVKAATSSNTSSSTLTVSGEAKNYKCRLTSAAAGSGSNCKLVKLDTTAKWLDITKIKNTPAQSPLPVTDLKVATNYFKLEVEDSLYNTINLRTSFITIDTTDAVGSHLPIATLTTLFKLDGTTPDYTGATHLLGKASSAATTISAKGDDKIKCSTKTTPTGTATECIAIAFGATTVATDSNNAKYSTQTFTHTTTPLKALEQHKYYLLKYTGPTSDLSEASLAGKTSAHITASTDTNWASKGTLTDLAPVIVDGTGDNAVAFILSTHTPKSA